MTFHRLFVFLLFQIVLLIGCNVLTAKVGEETSKRKLIVLSIDGLPAYYFEKESPFFHKTPNLRKLVEVSDSSFEVQSTYPSLTYPAHTTMVTGVDPAKHKIYFNAPIDWKGNLSGDWYWFDEDISVKTIWDFADEAGLETASIYWPVTVGAKISYNVPQFWKNRTEYDTKLIRAFSTKKMYNYLENKTKVKVGEFSGDKEKILFALETWKKYKPDILFIYTTDLDTVHHSHGVYSKKAGEVLEKIDSLVGEFILDIKLFNNPNIGFMIVSDHGFKKVEQICYPNQAFKELNGKKWKYKFKTFGGLGVLIRNQSIKKMNRKSLENLQRSVEENCPGAKAVFEGEEYTNLKNRFYGQSQMFLYTREPMSFSEAGGKWFQILNGAYYNHGFLPDDKEMETVHIFYPKDKNRKKLTDLKEILPLSCEWLDLECRVGESRSLGIE